MSHDPCPVCGLPYSTTEHIPENPDPTYPPHTTGTLYVHEWRADPENRGHVSINGCSEWTNAVQSDAWDALIEPIGEEESR